MSKELRENYGKVINKYVGCIGILGIASSFFVKTSYPNLSTVLLSVGTSILATAIVTGINAIYVLKTQRMEKLLSKWKLNSIYESKSQMNIDDANTALEKCNDSIDIIAEGLHNYINAKGTLLKDKIIHSNVKVRIISCDSEALLKLRAQEELGMECSGNDAVSKVKYLDQWVAEIRKSLGDKQDNIQIRYHSSYPGFSYLRIDTASFVSINLWGKPSQQCFALSFLGTGKGYTYFHNYFEELWENPNFIHEGCKL